MKPRVIVLRAAGTNCDAETAYAFTLVGAQATILHVNQLRADPGLLQGSQVLALPGGFSYGDDIASGRILATELMSVLRDALLAFIDRGGFCIGICNGFQVLVKAGLLPRLPARGSTLAHGAVLADRAEAGTASAARRRSPAATGGAAGSTGVAEAEPGPVTQQATLTDNLSGRYSDRWVRLRTDPRRCQWIDAQAEIELPVAHGEGRFVADPAVIAELEANHQIAMRYAPGSNPNGSQADIAGICDPTGRVFGLMPHPERFLRWENHPRWTREARREGDGVRFFRHAIHRLSES